MPECLSRLGLRSERIASLTAMCVGVPRIADYLLEISLCSGMLQPELQRLPTIAGDGLLPFDLPLLRHANGRGGANGLLVAACCCGICLCSGMPQPES